MFTPTKSRMIFFIKPDAQLDYKLTNFTGVLSLYNEEESLLNATLPIYLNQIAQIAGQLR